MKYSFIGDCHGKIDILLPLLEGQCNDSDLVLQLGDMGLGFKNVNLPDLKKFGFIRGNHDSPDLCKMHKNYAGEFGMWHDIFVIGGAFSIDWQMRIAGRSWWAAEELSTEQLDIALEAYKKAKPAIIASHDAPQMVGQQLLLDHGWRPEKWGSTTSRTAQYMQRMFNEHQPKHWFFGHYHRDWEREIEGCKFYCLNELAIRHFDTIE